MMNGRKLFCLVIAAVSLLANGCQSSRTHSGYSGPRLPREQIAVLDGSAPRNGVWITKIDGLPTEPPSSEHSIDVVELLPGEHTIEFKPQSEWFQTAASGSRITKSMLFAAGKTYVAEIKTFQSASSSVQQNARNGAIYTERWTLDVRDKSTPAATERSGTEYLATTENVR